MWHKQVLKLPIFGEMILKSMLARISLIMGNLSAAGVNLIRKFRNLKICQYQCCCIRVFRKC